MSLPEHINSKQVIITQSEFAKILSGLAKQHFSAQENDIINEFLSENSFMNINDFFNKTISILDQYIDINDLNNESIEEINYLELANDIYNILDRNKINKLTSKDGKNLEYSFENFARTLLHDIAFPLIAAENPNAAISAKNLLKRTFSTLYNYSEIDTHELYDKLDIENLPVKVNLEKILATGIKIGSLQLLDDKNQYIEKHVNTFLCCNLSTEQAIYLSYTLYYDYQAIKNWRSFYDFLKSNGSRYSNVIVKSNKIGLVTSVIHILYSKKNITGERYLHLNKGNGIWSIFQQYLIDSKTDKLFSRQLRKINNEADCVQEAEKIIDEILNQNQ
jgi:hypothetical protein